MTPAFCEALIPVNGNGCAPQLSGKFNMVIPGHPIYAGGHDNTQIGTALGWPEHPPLADGAFYPRADAVIAKLDAETPPWKQPIWWWVKRFAAWPSTPEVPAPAFASNRAPFFQCFVEVRVELSTNVVRLRPYTAHGRMKWPELQRIGRVGPVATDDSGFFEFTLPLPASTATR